MTEPFDLTPDPRVLQILGEISLDQWKCLAELIDNGIDAFAHARGTGDPVAFPEIGVQLPRDDREDAFIGVLDNGPGMSVEQLERAVRAGWTGNNPLDSLGLFGMGFNIATARLGAVTEVYTTRAGDDEWIGLRIDLNELRRTRSYQTARLTRPKPDVDRQGTEIRVLRLKPEQRAYFAKSVNHNKIKRQLARVYAPILRLANDGFKLQLNGVSIAPRLPCHWDPERHVMGPDGLAVHAVENFDFRVPSRRHCLTCMITFSGDIPCPSGAPDCKVVEVDRRVRGWVGLQRYLHEEDFGLDIVRNGRIIETQNKDMFVWMGGDRPEREYPIDDPRNRGRFIGEIHIDHCRVSYTKDRFERDDPAWAEMVSIVRGEGPLQPQKARSLGYGPQVAPLHRLFQAFRRSSPQGRTGRWSRVLAVKNNDRALEMADAFVKGDPDYQTDERWFALIEEEDRTLVGGGPVANAPSPSPPELPEGFLDAPPAATPPVEGAAAVPAAEPPPPSRHRSHELSRIYKHPMLKVEFNIEAFAAAFEDPELPRGMPWRLKMEDPGTRAFTFLFHGAHPVFRSATMTPTDAILSELSVKTYEFLRDTLPDAADYASILSEYRAAYANHANLEPRALIAGAEATLRDVARSLASLEGERDFAALFAALPDAASDAIRRKVATRGIADLAEIVATGEFLSHADTEDIRGFVRRNPDLFFDGKYWTQPFAMIDYGSAKVEEEARARVQDRYDSYLADAVWLTQQTPRDLGRAGRDELVRASASVRLLGSDI